MDEDVKINEKVELLDSNGEKSNGKKVELDSTVEKSNEKKVELDSTVEQSNEKEVELDSTIQQSNKRTVELDSAVEKSNKRKLELDSTVQQSNKRKKPKEVAIFGNYRNYYGYRIDQGMVEDPRIKVLKNEWFEGKDCLDIGCNSGLITITIAKKFCCRSIHGIDIDSARIEDAYWNLRRIMKTSTKKPLNAPKSENSNGVNSIENCATEPRRSEETMEINGDDPSPGTTTLSDKVSFKKENFVLNKFPTKDKCYDTIVCLSVTKWIHLNWGDEGLITLFSKIWRLLRPGGILILEPQPWISYSNNRQVSEIARQNYHEIEIYPQSFQEILLDKIGFRTVEDLSSSLSGTKSGFKRPILAFWK